MRIVVANRGEIALRVMRTARAMGLGCVAVHTPDEAGAAHVRAADLAVAVPSYLDAAAMVAAARASGATLVHPGYGFLAENAGFARACAEAGLTFVGPSPEAIALMGDKGAAKAAALAAGVPCLPGGGAEAAEAIGVPLMVKAAMGGGGKGMRLVTDLADLPEAMARARSEAEKAFGDGSLIVEKALLNPRHIEVQVFGDAQGNVVHLGERDCSVQRRHQKVVEEAPSPAVDEGLRERMGAAAVALARTCDYRGAGTVEFLLENGEFWFLEMNTRLQVEHPVTEAITGFDLVEWQIRVALGEPLPVAQEDIRLTGHAIEVRLYAEDPANGFLPQTGRVLRWAPAPGLRVEAALEAGQAVGAGFDPMLAKLIAHGATREEARARLIAGLARTRLQGVVTNRAFLARVLAHPGFVAGPTTAFLARDFAGDASLAPQPVPAATLALAVLAAARPGRRFGFTNGPPMRLERRFDTPAGPASVRFTLEGTTARLDDGTELVLEARGPDHLRVRIDGLAREIATARDGAVLWLDETSLTDVTLAPAQPGGAGGADGVVSAPMAGGVVNVAVTEGARVARGETLLLLEAMKMEHPVKSPCAGRVRALHIKAGAQVRARQVLIEIEAEEV